MMDLPVGTFEYKFEVDGEWKVNPSEQIVKTAEGIENNVIAINESHFEELENELLNDPNDANTSNYFNFDEHLHQKHAGINIYQYFPLFSSKNS